jgi:hypothetical protein
MRRICILTFFFRIFKGWSKGWSAIVVGHSVLSRLSIACRMFRPSLKTLIFVLTLSASVTMAQAQCPSPPPPPTTIPWVYGGIMFGVALNFSSSCLYDVEYCQRTVSGQTQYLITSITPQSGNTCPQSWDYIVNNIGIWFLGNLRSGCSPSGGCDMGIIHTTEEIMLGTCWEIVNINPSGTPIEECRLCTEETGYCLVSYESCCDNLGHNSVTKTGTTFQTSDGCSYTFNPLSYQYGVCYTMLECE